MQLQGGDGESSVGYGCFKENLNVNDANAQTNRTQNELELWRDEVRDFCEDALRQLQQLSRDLGASCSDARPHEKEASDPSVLEMVRQDEQAEAPEDGSDSSGNRLEKLKRQLSEKLRQSGNDTEE